MADDIPPKKNRHWEEAMLGEYLAKYHAECRVVTRARLGPLNTAVQDPRLTDEERRMLGSAWRRWADALCVEAGRLLVIETAFVPDPRDISLLLTYLRLIDVTPDLQEWARLPRQGILVWAVDDPFSRQLAVDHGIEVRLFKPANFTEWLTTVRARERRPSRTALGLSGVPLERIPS